MMNRRLLLCISFIISSITRAEIAFTHIKGMYNDIIEGKKHLSPVHGFNWYRTGIIENMYRFGDENQASIKLIKEMFYLQHDGVTFDTTYNKGKPATYFTPITIGKILNYFENNKITSESDQQSDLYAIISSDIGFNKKKLQELIKNKNELPWINKLLGEKINQVEKSSKSDEKKEKEIADLKQKIKDNNEKVTELDVHIKNIKQSINNITEASIKKLITTMLNCLKQDQDDVNSSNTLCNILLSFLWKKAESVEQFENYFEQFYPTIMLQNWVDKPYTKENYKELKILIENNFTAILDDYEQSSFYLCGVKTWGEPYPPIVFGIGRAEYKSPDGTIHTFPNCGESSLQNFFNIILYDREKGIFDVSILQDNKNITPLPALINYYKNHKEPSEVNTKLYYHSWAQLLSNLPGVNYVNKDYEIQVGLENILKVFNNLLFGNSLDFDKKTVEEKLDQITRALSRDQFTLSCEIIKGNLDKNENNNDVNTTLNFQVKAVSNFSFEWLFYNNHFVIPEIVSTSFSIKLLIPQQLVNEGMPKFYLLGWYKDVNILKNITDDQNQKLILAIYMQKLADSKVAQKVVVILLEKRTIYQSLIINLCELLPDDEDVFADIIRALPEEPKYEKFVDSFVNELMENKPILVSIVNQKKEALYPYIKQENFDKSQYDLLMYAIIKNQVKDLYFIITKESVNNLENSDLDLLINTIIENKVKELYWVITEESVNNLEKSDLYFVMGAIIKNQVKELYFIITEDSVNNLENSDPYLLINTIIENKVDELYFVITKKLLNKFEGFELASVMSTIIENKIEKLYWVITAENINKLKINRRDEIINLIMNKDDADYKKIIKNLSPEWWQRIKKNVKR